MSDDDELLAAVSQLAGEAASLRDDVAHVADQSRRLRLVLILLCAVIVALCVVAGVQWRQSQQREDDRRDEAVADCQRSNDVRGNVRDLADALDGIVDLVAGPRDRTPERQQAVDQLVADARKLTADARPALRHC